MRNGQAWPPFLSCPSLNVRVWFKPSVGGSVDIHVSSGGGLQRRLPDEPTGWPLSGVDWELSMITTISAVLGTAVTDLTDRCTYDMIACFENI